MSEINIFETYASKDFDVFFQDDVKLDTQVDISYIKSGEEEIKQYVENFSKPEIDDYVSKQAGSLSSVAEEYRNEAEDIADRCRQSAEEAQKNVADIRQQSEEIDEKIRGFLENIGDLQGDFSEVINGKLNEVRDMLEQLVTIDGEQTISGNKTFTGTLTAVTASQSDRTTKVATTAYVNGGNIISKGSDYIKFGTGLIVQWGRIGVDSQSHTVNYKLPFSGTSYTMSTARSSGATATNGAYSILIQEATTTYFRCYSVSSAGWFWLAIGF